MQLETQRKLLLVPIIRINELKVPGSECKTSKPEQITWLTAIASFESLITLGASEKLNSAFKILLNKGTEAPKCLQTPLNRNLLKAVAHIPADKLTEIIFTRSIVVCAIAPFIGDVALEASRVYVAPVLAYTVGLEGLTKIKANDISIDKAPFNTILRMFNGVIKANQDSVSDIINYFSFIWEHRKAEARKEIPTLIKIVLQTHEIELVKWVLTYLQKNRLKKMQVTLLAAIPYIVAKPESFEQIKSFVKYLYDYCTPTHAQHNKLLHILHLYGIIPTTTSVAQYILHAALVHAEKGKLEYSNVKHRIYKALKPIICGLKATAIMNPSPISGSNVTSASRLRLSISFGVPSTNNNLCNVLLSLKFTWSSIELRILKTLELIQTQNQIQIWKSFHSQNKSSTNLNLQFKNSTYILGYLGYAFREERMSYDRYTMQLAKYVLANVNLRDLQYADTTCKADFLIFCNVHKGDAAEKYAEIVVDNLVKVGKLEVTYTIICESIPVNKQAWILERIIGLGADTTKLDMLAIATKTYTYKTTNILWSLKYHPELLVKVLQANPLLRNSTERINWYIRTHLEDFSAFVLDDKPETEKTYHEVVKLFRNDEPWYLYKLYNQTGNQRIADTLKNGPWEWPNDVEDNGTIKPLPTAINVNKDIWLLEILAARGYNIFKPFEGKTIFNELEEAQAKTIIDLFIEANKPTTPDYRELEIDILLG